MQTSGTKFIHPFTLGVAAYLALGASANAGSTAQNSLQLISVGKPIYASPDFNANVLVDGKLDNWYYWTAGPSTWAAINLGKSIGKAMVIWRERASQWSDSIGSHMDVEFLPSYEILTSNNSSNGVDGTWSQKVAVTDNSASKRAHLIDFGGDSWVRINFHASTAATLSEIQVFDAPDGNPDGWFFLGTSITNGSQLIGPTDSSQAQMVSARAPNLTLPMIGGGIAGINSTVALAGINKYLKMTPPLPYWAIEMGTNDGWGGGSGNVSSYAKNMQAIIDSAKAHGITPILARSPSTDTSRAHWQLDSGYIRTVDSLRTKNQLATGPDFYSYFLAHPEAHGGDGVHLDAAGNYAMRRMWAEAIILSGIYNKNKTNEHSALVSNGKPVFSSPANGGLSLTDGKFETTDWTFGKDSWAALQVGSGAKKVLSLWSQSVYSSWSDSITKSSRCAEGFPVVTNYEILTSNNSTNGADGDWTTKASVTHNIASARANLIDFDGASWVKVHIANGSGSLGEFQIFDATDTLPNGLFFLGTSITAISQRQFPQDSTVADLILARKPGIRPAVINGGVVCLTSNEVAANISKYIAMTSPLRYWAIELGLNDGWGNGSAWVTDYAKNMQTIIDSARAHGIVPIIATPPATDPTRTGGGPWQLDWHYARVVDSLNKANHLAPGPDFYGYFQSHPNELTSNGINPSQVGSLAMRRMWADAIVASGIYKNTYPSSIRHPEHSGNRLPFSISQQKGSFTIHSLKTDEFEITTFSLSGQKMTQTKTVVTADQDRTIDLRLQKAPPGVFLVRVRSKMGTAAFKYASQSL